MEGCTRCGFCCQLEVAISREDIQRLRKAGYKSFIRRGKRENFLRKKGKYCIFYDNGCRVYPHRPEICRVFPFRERKMSEYCTRRNDFYAKVSRKVSRFLIEGEKPGKIR